MRKQVLWGVLAVAAVTLAAGVVAGTAIRRNLIEDRQTELARQAQATATLIVASVRDNFPSNDRNESIPVARTLEIARAIGGYDYVEAEVVGVPAARASVIELPATPLLDSLGPGVPLNEVVESTVDGTLVLAYVRSVPINSRSEARLVVAIGTAEPLLAANLLTRPLLFSLGAGAILAIFLAAWLARHVGRRLDRVSTASQQIADGDFTARAPSEGSDDVARLGAAFNEMVNRLEDGKRRERDFLMSVGHDLRTPLTTLRGYAEALDAGEIEADDLARVGGVLRRQTDRLSRLIEDLTLLSRLEAREFSLRPEAVDLAALMNGLVDGARDRAEVMHVKLVGEVQNVGEVWVDADRVAQIFGNLVDNAMRYTPEGGTVTVRLEGSHTMVAVVVADTGPGIDGEDLEHVFERLYVAQRYRPVRPEGSGLGLSIVKELVDALQGSITVDSALGRGTTVTVELPRGSIGT